MSEEQPASEAPKETPAARVRPVSRVIVGKVAGLVQRVRPAKTATEAPEVPKETPASQESPANGENEAPGDSGGKTAT